MKQNEIDVREQRFFFVTNYVLYSFFFPPILHPESRSWTTDFRRSTRADIPLPRARKIFNDLGIPQSNEAIFFRDGSARNAIRQRRIPLVILICSETFSTFRRDDASSYPWGADHLQGHRVAFNFPDVAIDLVGGKTYVLTLLLIRHVRQDQSLPRSAFQRHAAVREYLCPSAHAWPHIENANYRHFQLSQ